MIVIPDTINTGVEILLQNNSKAINFIGVVKWIYVPYLLYITPQWWEKMPVVVSYFHVITISLANYDKKMKFYCWASIIKLEEPRAIITKYVNGILQKVQATTSLCIKFSIEFQLICRFELLKWIIVFPIWIGFCNIVIISKIRMRKEDSDEVKFVAGLSWWLLGKDTYKFTRYDISCLETTVIRHCISYFSLCREHFMGAEIT